MKDISEKIIDKIQKEHIDPKSKWHFVIKSTAIWGAVLMTLVLASIVSSAVIFNIINTDWGLRSHLGWGMARFIFMSLPFFWLILLVALAIAAYYEFKKTKSGYKYTLPIALIFIFLFVLSAGAIWHKGFNAGDIIERRAMKHLPYYPKVMPNRTLIWCQPEKGVLGGKIITINTPQEFELSDFNKKVWLVNCSENCVKHPAVAISQDEMVKIIGQIVSENNFEASQIRPFFIKFSPLDGQVKGMKMMPMLR